MCFQRRYLFDGIECKPKNESCVILGSNPEGYGCQVNYPLIPLSLIS